MKEYPIATKFNIPKSVKRKMALWRFASILLILNLVMLGLFAITFIGRLFLQLIGLVDVRSQGKKLKIKPVQPHPQGLVPKVCVIGCGASGLVAVKECVENGLEVEAYDMHHEVGGVLPTHTKIGTSRLQTFLLHFRRFPVRMPICLLGFGLLGNTKTISADLLSIST